jgi:hypothetical protein
MLKTRLMKVQIIIALGAILIAPAGEETYLMVRRL